MSLTELTTAWNSFFHAPESCAPYVLFRLLFGSLLTINVLLLFPVMKEFLAPTAIWNVTAWQQHQGRSRLCLLHLMPLTIGSVRTLLLLHLAACIAFTIGWQYRIAAVIVFVTLVSIHHRNTFILSSGDTVLRLMSFLAMFAPAAEALSVDAWITTRPSTMSASQLWPHTDVSERLKPASERRFKSSQFES